MNSKRCASLAVRCGQLSFERDYRRDGQQLRPGSQFAADLVVLEVSPGWTRVVPQRSWLNHSSLVRISPNLDNDRTAVAVRCEPLVASRYLARWTRVAPQSPIPPQVTTKPDAMTSRPVCFKTSAYRLPVRMLATDIIVLLAKRVPAHSRRGGRVAEGGGLLNRYTVKSCIGGSNPPLSAT